MRNYLATTEPLFNIFFDENCYEHNVMKTDICESKDSYLIKVDLPEVKKEDIKVELKDGYLVITASRHKEIKEDEEEGYIHNEICYGEYSRSFYVGKDVEIKNIDAKLNDGVLTLNIKKVNKQEEPHFVEIK